MDLPGSSIACRVTMPSFPASRFEGFFRDFVGLEKTGGKADDHQKPCQHRFHSITGNFRAHFGAQDAPAAESDQQRFPPT
jgi:hypothetical protein